MYSVDIIHDENQLLQLRDLVHPSTPVDVNLKLMLLDYYLACSETYHICTVVVNYDHLPILFIPGVEVDKKLSFFGSPAFSVQTLNMQLNMLETSMQMIYKYICNFCANKKLGFILYCPENNNRSDEISDIQLLLLKSGANMRFNYNGFIKTYDQLSQITSQVRKSYKSLINWGKREMELVFIDVNNLDYDAFNNFRLFHRQISGKITRPYKSWQIMFDLIKRQQAILCMGYFNNKLAAATYLFLHQEMSLYGTGVYDRTRFDKPISHWPLIATIHKAFQYGSSVCDLGSIYLDNSYSLKEQNIAFFKQGFSSTVHSKVYWYLESQNF